MNILSIQSHVAYGHVGNAAAVFPMQRLGVEAWAINTVQFSNHTGYGAWRGRVFDGADIADLVEGIAERGALPSCDGVLSGYMGASAIGTAILDAVARVRAANPQALYCCDPVIGDVGRGIFVRPGIPDFMRDQALPAADIVTPNQFELDYLSAMETPTLAAAQAAARRLHDIGPSVVLVTSLHTIETPEDCLDLLASARDGDAVRQWRLRTPKLPVHINGAGDAIAALFFVHYAKSRSAATALGEAAAAVHGVLRRTLGAGSREILLVAAQDELVNPSRRFPVEEL